jgi:organic hydroperoxide reductase OsmC/OhrA
MVEYEQTGEGFSIRTGHPLLGDIHAKFSTVGPDKRRGTASALLEASCLNCWCGTLSTALLARGVEKHRITGTAHVARVQKKDLSWLDCIELDVKAEVDDEDAEVLEECLAIVKGCMVTRSIAEGMEVVLHAERARAAS